MFKFFNKQLIIQLQKDFQSKRLVPYITTGLVIGIINILTLISYGALIFSGSLSEYVSSGIGLMLFGAFVIGLFTALTSSYEGTIALPQDSPAAVLALITATIALRMSPAATSDETFFTVVVTIALTSILIGILFLVMGKLKLGKMIRFIPYPVVGGFMAGVGLLVVKGAFSTMTGMSLSLSQIPHLIQYEIIIKWLPGLIFAIILFSVLRKFNHFLIMPAMFITAIALFYLILLLTNTSISEARNFGLLFEPFKGNSLWRPITFSTLSQVNWQVIFGQIGNIGTILIISIISFLLNATGIELAIKRDIDLDIELQSVGIASIIAGCGGGPVGYHSLSKSVLAGKMGFGSRLTGIFSASVCGMTLFFGASIVSFFPKPVLGGSLLFLGLSFLIEWTYDARLRLPKTDYFLVLLILIAIGTFGFLEGVALGMFVAVILFVVQYSRINVVKHVLSGANYQSNVDREVLYQRLLLEKGEQTFILKLQGYIFFGTANSLLQQVRQRAKDTKLQALRFVIFDFRLVNGFDSSALSSFIRMKHIAESQKFQLVFTHLLPKHLKQFEREGFTNKDDTVTRIFSDLDYGVEWCEEQILIAEKENDVKASIEQELFRGSFPESVFKSVIKYLEKQEVAKGHYLIHQGDPPQNLYFIVSGQVEVKLESQKGKSVRLRKMGEGTVVGELGLYLGVHASASVVTSKPGILYRLSANSLKKMEDNDPEIAAVFHKHMVSLLSERLINTNNTLRTLLD